MGKIYPSESKEIREITLLNAVTATGAGSTITLEGLFEKFTVIVSYATAAPTAVTVKLQGSLDNSNWVDLGNTTDVSATVVGFASVDRCVPYIRGNLSAYTAGSCTGVTAKCVAAF